MKVLIDINHPAHVHYFKHTIQYLKDNGHKVIVVARDREFVAKLLKDRDIEFYNRGKGKNSRLGKLLYMMYADLFYLKVSIKEKPDLFLSFSTPYPHHIAYLLGKHSIALNDSEHTDKIHSKLTYPFCHSIITPSSYQNNIGKKQIKFNGVIESLYLNHKYFKSKYNIREDLNLQENEQFVIIRFVSWNAHHDFGQQGLDLETKIKLINVLKDKYRIFISSEGKLPKELKQYEIKISPEKMHDVLYHANLFIGESATMASESALLGTQSICINSLPIMCNLQLAEKVGLLKYFNDTTNLISYVINLIKEPNLKQNSIEKSLLMQKEYINATDFLNWYLVNFPKSDSIIKENPEYQLEFPNE